MANSTVVKTSPAVTSGNMAILAPVVGWLVPGGGHLIQKKWGRGALLFVSITAMFFIGLAMQGHIYKPNGGDILDMLGFVGDLGAGVLYFLARSMDWGVNAVAHATGDYGTKFIIVAGLLNIVSIADAHHIAIGKKP